MRINRVRVRLKIAKIGLIFCSIFLLFLSVIPVASAVVLRVDPATSVIHTSGGIDGLGFGDLLLEGSFDVTISDTSSLPNYFRMVITNIDFRVAAIVDPVNGEQSQPPADLWIPDIWFGSGFISKIDGTFTNSSFCPAAIGVICPAFTLSGSFDGTNFSLLSQYTGALPDAYSYNTTLNASVVPIPAAIWLFGSALLVLTGMARRKGDRILGTLHRL